MSYTKNQILELVNKSDVQIFEEAVTASRRSDLNDNEHSIKNNSKTGGSDPTMT